MQANNIPIPFCALLEPFIVAINLLNGQRAVELASIAEIKNLFPAIGPFPLKDVFGMSAAVVTLLKSQDAGHCATTLKSKNAQYFVQYLGGAA
jgi:hypothetical protein